MTGGMLERTSPILITIQGNGMKKESLSPAEPTMWKGTDSVLPGTKEQGVPPLRLFTCNGHLTSFAFYFQLWGFCNPPTWHRAVVFHTALERNTQIFIAYVNLTCIVLHHKYSLIVLPFLSGLPDISIPTFPQVFPKST